MSTSTQTNDTAIGSSQSYYVSFTYSDRCDNYDLENCAMPAPEADSISDNNTATVTTPYRGTEAVSGIWHFQDEVVYEKDADTMRVTIQYAHDALRDSRKHVIMMKNDGSGFLQYDLWTDIEGDEPVMARCVASA